MATSKHTRRDGRGIIQGQATSGKSVAAYCREQGVSQSQYYRWRRRYGAGATGGAEPGFVELTRVDAPVSRSGVVVVTNHGWRLELAPGFDVSTLEQVLAVVARSGACSP